MDFFEAVERRRSIRKFADTPVTDAEITKIIEAARLAPSGSNAQPWKFLVVRDAEMKNKLMPAAAGQPFVAECGALIVCLGDRRAFKRRLRTGKQLVEIGAVDIAIVEKAAEFYKKRDEQEGSAERSIFLNCAIAVEHMALAATALGLGSCWVMLMDAAEIARILNLPEHLFAVALLPIGHTAQDPAPRPRSELGDIAFAENLDTPWPVSIQP